MAWLHGDGKTKEGKEKKKEGEREGRLIIGHVITCL